MRNEISEDETWHGSIAGPSLVAPSTAAISTLNQMPLTALDHEAGLYWSAFDEHIVQTNGYLITNRPRNEYISSSSAPGFAIPYISSQVDTLVDINSRYSMPRPSFNMRTVDRNIAVPQIPSIFYGGFRI